MRGTGFGELRVNAVAVDGEERAVVSGASQNAAIGSQPERINEFLVRRPELIGSAIGSETIDAARETGGKAM